MREHCEKGVKDRRSDKQTDRWTKPFLVAAKKKVFQNKEPRILKQSIILFAWKYLSDTSPLSDQESIHQH